MTDPESALLDVLERAQRRGFIGPGPLQPHIAHSMLFALALDEDAPPGLVVDLGSGGGIPAIPVAVRCPDRRLLLIESQHRRAAHLRWAVKELDLADRLEVVEGRAEVVVRDHRATAAAVLARAFGRPATTAECAAPFLQIDGVLIVSEPPGSVDPGRWDERALEEWGQALGARRETPEGSIQLVHQREAAPPTLPRRVGMAAKRPRF